MAISEIIKGLLIPFLGTSIGAALVFFIKKELNGKLVAALCGFSAGVMIAAAVFSLILPSVELSQEYYGVKLLAPLVGFFVGAGFMTVIDLIAPEDTGIDSGGVFRSKNMKMLFFGVTLHNLPEGMAVGIVYAGILSGETSVSLSGAAALSLGIAVQNIPEGAIISMPLASLGMSKKKACFFGVLPGVVEPVGGLIAVAFFRLAKFIAPFLLSFAAGAMIFVAIKELVPESILKSKLIATLAFLLGFILMTSLDICL